MPKLILTYKYNNLETSFVFLYLVSLYLVHLITTQY